MSAEFDRLLGLHELAAQHGGGLKPELYALLVAQRAAARQGLFPLGASPKSAGPVHHALTAKALAEKGIARIGSATGPLPLKVAQARPKHQSPGPSKNAKDR